jgi:hypothetical protein
MSDMAERLIRERIFFFLLIGILVILTLVMLWPFVSAILLAVAVVVILKPLYNWLLEKKWMKDSEGRAAGATIIMLLEGEGPHDPLFFCRSKRPHHHWEGGLIGRASPPLPRRLLRNRRWMALAAFGGSGANITEQDAGPRPPVLYQRA